MAFDILGLLAKFRSIDDREFEGIIYKTHTPEIAPLAYHTIVLGPVRAWLSPRAPLCRCGLRSNR
jgi:hypothetical protein